MWITKDERRLLAGYYSAIGDVGETKVYRVGSLVPLLRCWGRNANEYGDTRDTDSTFPKDDKKWLKRYFDQTNRIKWANKHLATRKLIVLEQHQHENDVVIVGLTLDGYDLGRKYTSWISRSGIWFDEYKGHWLWLVAAFVGGGAASKLLELILSSVFPAINAK